MGAYSEAKLITKNTFLEFVVDDKSPNADARRRSYTDGAIICRDHKVLEVKEDARPLQENIHLQAPAEHAEGPATETAAMCAAGAPQESNMEALDQSMVVPMGAMGSATAWFIPMVFMQPEQSCAGKVQQSRQMAGLPQFPTVPRDRQATQAGASRKPFISIASHTSRASAPCPEEFTTLMLRNLPNTYTRDMLVDLLNSEGFAGTFNFVYLPIDFKTHAGLGYAFVDLISTQETDRMRRHFEGFSGWAVRSEKVCSVSWSHPEQQGFPAHVERYRNSPVMHECVPDSWKPALYAGGARVSFPPPTRKLRNPHIRNL